MMSHTAARPIPLLLAALFLTSLTSLACSPESPPSASTSSPSESHSLWSCGMHPEVLEHEPGTCPICGMDLTPISSPAGPGKSADAGAASAERRIKHWVAPMDPTYIAEGPGKSPMGMDLVPVYEDDAGARASGMGAVTIDPAVIQNMGVRLERVTRQPLFRHLRTIGEVEVAEDHVSVVNLRFSGWVENIHVDRTGDRIERGEPLIDIYSPELIASQEEYLLALRAKGEKSDLARSARRRLGFFDLAPRDIDALVRSGKVESAVAVRAPRSGYVLEKNVVEGAHIEAGQDLYTIADLSKIWVQAEVYEYDAPWVEVGQSAQMELTYQKGRVIEGTVAYVYPTLNEHTRTVSVRLEFPNPDLRFKPGMFATVYIQFRREDDALAIPTEAILHSGTREIVFVATGDGRFEPREVTTGLVGDHHMTQVLSGLEGGEEVVTSGQFLIDSESQLHEAISKMLARRSATSPVLDAQPPGDALYVCPMHAEVTSHEPGRCPICGMDLELDAEAQP